MPGSAEFVQRMVHALETGAASTWMRRSLALVGVAALSFVFLYNFRGLATSQAMDQAQIGRAILFGQGWHSNYARPLAVDRLQRHGREVQRRLWVDTYNAPLAPLVDAFALFPVRSRL